MDQRVDESDDTFEEKYLRKKRSAINRRINEKLQYIAKNGENLIDQHSLEETLIDEPEDIKLSQKREIILSNISKDSKEDPKYIKELLVSLYKPEQLTNLCVTGKSTRNSKLVQYNKNGISPNTMKYIIRKFFFSFF